MDDIIPIFPMPIMIARGVVTAGQIEALVDHFERSQTGANVRTALLRHTDMENPRGNEVYRDAMSAVLPYLRRYGKSLMGEELAWAVKEIWINRMEREGAQKMHNHANSFISGVLYLTETDASAATVFYRQVGAQGFVMSNENRRCEIGPYNAPVFRMPPVAPGDMVLFPSYVMHEVPPNQGKPRMTAAFNALPERLDSWGYVLKFR